MAARYWGWIYEALEYTEPEDRPTLRRIVSEQLEGSAASFVEVEGSQISMKLTRGAGTRESHLFAFQTGAMAERFLEGFRKLCSVCEAKMPGEAA